MIIQRGVSESQSTNIDSAMTIKSEETVAILFSDLGIDEILLINTYEALSS